MQIELSVLFSVFCALVGVFATYIKVRRDFKEDEEKRRKELADEQVKQTERHIEIKKGIEYLAKDVGKLDTSMCSMTGKLDDIDRRLTITEESTKSAHHRLDTIESRGKYERN